MQFFTFLSEQLARISCGLLQVFVANGHEESSSLSWEHSGVLWQDLAPRAHRELGERNVNGPRMRVSDFLAAEAELAASETMGVNRYIRSPRNFLFEHLQVLHDPADSVGSLLRCVNVIARFGYSIPALTVAQAEAERFELAQVVSPCTFFPPPCLVTHCQHF